MNTQVAKVGRLVFSTDEQISFRFKDVADSCFCGESANLAEEVKNTIEAGQHDREAGEKAADDLWQRFGLTDDDLEPIRIAGWSGAWEWLICDIAEAAAGIWLPRKGHSRTEPPPIEFKFSGDDQDWTSVSFEVPVSGPSAADVRQKISDLGWSIPRVAKALHVNRRTVRRWCRQEDGRRGITDDEWARLTALENAPEPVEPPAAQPTPPPSIAGKRHAKKGFSDDELRAIDEALRAGRYKRIEGGGWSMMP